ncbi:hypothetical protein LWI29_033400 [Acer saccharum]|uniref:Putative plant transposon protein domain-containing protein n=1 Tax=Acer saccharum TaxID=4024 RepID=A0AA39RXZ5_ACESA|nr:hypothetical protein LWI29_033400 [Acer saccharum]
MVKAKKVGVSNPTKLIDNSNLTSSSKSTKANKFRTLRAYECKKILQEKGIDLNYCIDSYVNKVIIERNWSTWINMLGIANETMVREFYHVFKESTNVEDAIMNMRGVVFRVNSWKLNEFLGLPDDIESDFLDANGKRAFIRQGELTKVSAFWHLFVCANLVGSSNATELNKEKIKIVNALVTNKPINLGEVLIEHIEIAACATRLDKKLAFPRFISHLCLAKGLKRQDEDVLLPPLENFSEKRMATMSYKEKGKSSDTFRLFSESHDSSHVSSTPILLSWAIQLKNEVEESRRMIEASQRKIEDLNAKVVLQDEKIKELERKATTTKHYVRSSHHTTFLGGTSG